MSSFGYEGELQMYEQEARQMQRLLARLSGGVPVHAAANAYGEWFVRIVWPTGAQFFISVRECIDMAVRLYKRKG